MILSFTTKDATQLKNDIIKKIEDEELETWSIHNRTLKYLKHTGQWSQKGVISLTVNETNDWLIAEVKKFTSYTGSVKDFEGYYLGRFCEAMFVNFHERFTTIIKS